MRIAQVSPLYESVPPQLYGGTERVVSFLTEELLELGHEVTLFASGDSVTGADLVPCAPRSLRLDRGCVDELAHHVRMVEEVCRRADEFDVIHFHLDYIHFSVVNRCHVPHVTTQHGRLDIPDLQPLYRTFRDVPLVSISDAQRVPLRGVNWQGTVYHGLPSELLTYHPQPGRYLAFLGRISPEKRVDRAIEIAKRVGMPLKIAAKIDRKEADYYERHIRPLLDHPLVEYVGEIDEHEKDAFLGNAAALLFPIDWPEPFGLVVIEALACGTPVVAFRRGSVPEIMREGVSGFMVGDVEDAVRATRRALALPRGGCRAYFERRFLARRMAEDYLAIYRRLASRDAGAAEALEVGPLAETPAGDVAEPITGSVANLDVT